MSALSNEEQLLKAAENGDIKAVQALLPKIKTNLNDIKGISI